MTRILDSLGLIYHLFRKHILRKDVQMIISPITVRHIERYRLAGNYLKPGIRVLDAACGSGYGSLYLGDVDYTGIDNDAGVIQYASRNYAGKFKNCSIHDIQDLGNFDAIVSMETLEHLDDPKSAFSDFRTILNTGGMMIISFPLNHPDTIYHKHIFDSSSVKELLYASGDADRFDTECFLQEGIVFNRVDLDSLDNNSDGTLIVVLRDRSSKFGN